MQVVCDDCITSEAVGHPDCLLRVSPLHLLMYCAFQLNFISLYCSFWVLICMLITAVSFLEVVLTNTIAGDGTVGDAGLATASRLRSPCGVAVDASGNINIADTYNNRIRMVTKSTGIITTVAGNGNYGYSGDGGLATSASLRRLYSAVVDASGNIYIADTFNNRIRKVTKSTGIITTVAGNGNYGYSGDGGLATSARLYNPYGAAADVSGNIYIADTYNNRIRMVTTSTGIITTVAGNGTYGYSGDGGLATSARLRYPSGVAFDASGNVYIADTYNGRIRLLTKSTGIITTVAIRSATEYKRHQCY